MQAGRDPIERASNGTRDLYDISTWEPRSRVDRFAQRLYRAIFPTLRRLFYVLTVLILLAVVSQGVFGAVLDPAVGSFVLLSAVPAALLAAYVYRADVTTGEPLRLLVPTFLLGLLFASVAGIFNDLGSVVSSIPLVGFPLFYLLVVGPVEETVKLLAVRLYAYRSPRFDAVVDGAVYGAAAGLGFATIENALYIGRVLADGEAVFGIAFVRALAGPGHVIYSAIAGYYLGLAKFNPGSRGPIVIKGLTIATLVHATYNLTVGAVPAAVTAQTGLSPGLAFVGYVVVYDGAAGYYLYRKLKRYRQEYEASGAGVVYDERDFTPEVTEFDPSARDDAEPSVGD